jgi:peroxiredoxin
VTKTDQTIAGRVEEFHAQVPDLFPSDVWEVITQEQEAHRATAPGKLPAVGSLMPDGELLDAHGRATTLSATRGGRVAVVVLYRGSWCPYCNITLRTYQDELAPELAAHGGVLIALSPQKPDEALSLQEKNELAFPVLSDPGNQIATALGVLTAFGTAAHEAVSAVGIDVPAGNADGTLGIPMPTVVLVDAAGAIRWIDVHADYTTRTEAAQIREHLAGLGH